MSLFGAIVRTAVNVACLPVDAVKDAVTAFPDACEERPVGRRIRDRLQEIKEDADD